MTRAGVWVNLLWLLFALILVLVGSMQLYYAAEKPGAWYSGEYNRAVQQK